MSGSIGFEEACPPIPPPPLSLSRYLIKIAKVIKTTFHSSAKHCVRKLQVQRYPEEGKGQLIHRQGVVRERMVRWILVRNQGLLIL